jgi:DNA-binding IclR family transcriptional regulator
VANVDPTPARHRRPGAADTGLTGVIPRALALLRLLSEPEVDHLAATEVARSTGIPLQTVHRLLKELGDGGLVLQDPDSRRWSLGPFAVLMGMAGQRQISWLHLAREVLTTITEATRETTILTLRHGAYGTHYEMVESPQRLRLIEYVGLRLPLTVGASRRVILAQLEGKQRRAVLDRLANDGIATDLQQIEMICEQIRTDGYEVSRGEVTDHTVGVAVPLIYEGQPVASTMVAGPDHRMDPKAIVLAVTELQRGTAALQEIWGMKKIDTKRSNRLT